MATAIVYWDYIGVILGIEAFLSAVGLEVCVCHPKKVRIRP